MKCNLSLPDGLRSSCLAAHSDCWINLSAEFKNRVIGSPGETERSSNSSTFGLR